MIINPYANAKIAAEKEPKMALKICTEALLAGRVQHAAGNLDERDRNTLFCFSSQVFKSDQFYESFENEANLVSLAMLINNFIKLFGEQQEIRAWNNFIIDALRNSSPEFHTRPDEFVYLCKDININGSSDLPFSKVKHSNFLRDVAWLDSETLYKISHRYLYESFFTLRPVKNSDWFNTLLILTLVCICRKSADLALEFSLCCLASAQNFDENELAASAYYEAHTIFEEKKLTSEIDNYHELLLIEMINPILNLSPSTKVREELRLLKEFVYSLRGKNLGSIKSLGSSAAKIRKNHPAWNELVWRRAQILTIKERNGVLFARESKILMNKAKNSAIADQPFSLSVNALNKWKKYFPNIFR